MRLGRYLDGYGYERTMLRSSWSDNHRPVLTTEDKTIEILVPCQDKTLVVQPHTTIQRSPSWLRKAQLTAEQSTVSSTT